ncbi:hypothetical protein CQ10_41140 [Bradyrhizobium valentinum]|nr:hypothetical protein CQ10_41140 [Bradyrhizobium valentinum]
MTYMLDFFQRRSPDFGYSAFGVVYLPRQQGNPIGLSKGATCAVLYKQQHQIRPYFLCPQGRNANRNLDELIEVTCHQAFIDDPIEVTADSVTYDRVIGRQ